MNSIAWTAPVLLLACIAPAGAVGEAGMIEACRTPGVASITDGRPITLPGGSMFADLSDARDRNPSGDTYRPVRLRLLQPSVIAGRHAAGRGARRSPPTLKPSP